MIRLHVLKTVNYYYGCTRCFRLKSDPVLETGKKEKITAAIKDAAGFAVCARPRRERRQILRRGARTRGRAEKIERINPADG